MLIKHFRAIAVLVVVGAAAVLAGDSARGFSTFSADPDDLGGFADLVTNPNDYWSWDNTGPGEVSLTYKFDSSFTADPLIRQQVRLAFNQWDFASWFPDPPSSPYSYNRNSGWQPFGDIRSIAVHEIGHVLGLHHPNQADAVGRNYGLTGDGAATPQADQGTEVLRSSIAPGEYNHILTRDELTGYEYVCGSRDFDFTEISLGTPDILVKAGPAGGSTTWAQGGPSGVYRSLSDPFQGIESTSGEVTFNTGSSQPMGLKTLGVNWDYQNTSGQPTAAFEVRTRGTNNTTPIFHYDGSPAQRFSTYFAVPKGANFKDDVVHKWTNPSVGGSPGPFPASAVVHVGLEQDVWDWTPVSAQVISPSNVRTNAPVLGFHEWSQTVTGVGAPSTSGSSSQQEGITTFPQLKVVHQGLLIANSQTTPAELVGFGVALVDDMDLQLSDLNRTMLNRLIKQQRFELLNVPRMTLDEGQELILVLSQEPPDPDLGAIHLNRPDLLGHELFVFGEARTDEAIVRTFGLLGRGPITGVLVPEPGVWVMLVAGGLFAVVVYRRRRRSCVCPGASTPTD